MKTKLNVVFDKDFTKPCNYSTTQEHIAKVKERFTINDIISNLALETNVDIPYYWNIISYKIEAFGEGYETNFLTEIITDGYSSIYKSSFWFNENLEFKSPNLTVIKQYKLAD